MKNYSLLICLILFLVSCTKQSKESKKYKDNFTIRVIDGCEYLEYEHGTTASNAYTYSITHKGDCKNQIHKCK